MDVVALGDEPQDRSFSDLRRDWKRLEVGASVRIYLLPVLTRSGAAACNSEPALPVEATSSPSALIVPQQGGKSKYFRVGKVLPPKTAHRIFLRKEKTLRELFDIGA